jgi:HAD superfamily hydrolase (TIGR01509 family)
MFFFDLDGTLIDSNGIWKQIDKDFLARRNLPYTKEYYDGVAHTALPLAAEFTNAYCHLEESCEEIIAEWMEMSRDAYARVPLKPGVRAYLKQCKTEGRRMAVVTSSVPEHCFTALKKLDLEKYFENVTFAQQAGMHKRHPDVWLAAAEKNGVRPEDCTVFDDSLAACSGARLAKMRVVGVHDDFFNVDEKEMRAFCDVYIRSFEELLWLPEQKIRRR